MRKSVKWPMVAIKEFAEVITGGTPSTSVNAYWKDGNIPWLNSGELNKGVIIQAENFITEAGLTNSAARLMPEDTVLVALTGATTGISALLKIRACANQSVTGVLPSIKHDARFLLQYFRCIRSMIVSDSWGGAQRHISQAYVKELKVPLPPLLEQQRIAEVLEQAEALRTKRRIALDQVDALTQAIFADCFGDLQKQRVVPLESLASTKRHALSSGPFGSSLTSKHYTNQGVLVLRGLNVSGGDVTLNDCKFVSESKAQELSRSTIVPGDIVIVAVGTSGFACLIPQGFPPAIMSQNFNKISPNLSIVDATYLCFSLNSSFVQCQFSQGITDTVRTFLSLTKVKKVSIPLPPLLLQHEFARRIAAVENLKTAHRASLAKLDELFSSLQHRAFVEEL